jgi:hypothetical protein
MVQPRSSRRGLGTRRGTFGGGFKAAPVTSRWPSDVAQFEHKYSWSSPVGSTSSNFSRTGCELPHFGQYNSLAVNAPNCCDMLTCRLYDPAQNIAKHLGGRLGRIDFMHQLLAVKT